MQLFLQVFLRAMVLLIWRVETVSKDEYLSLLHVPRQFSWVGWTRYHESQHMISTNVACWKSATNTCSTDVLFPSKQQQGQQQLATSYVALMVLCLKSKLVYNIHLKKMCHHPIWGNYGTVHFCFWISHFSVSKLVVSLVVHVSSLQWNYHRPTPRSSE